MRSVTGRTATSLSSCDWEMPWTGISLIAMSREWSGSPWGHREARGLRLGLGLDELRVERHPLGGDREARGPSNGARDSLAPCNPKGKIARAAAER